MILLPEESIWLEKIFQGLPVDYDDSKKQIVIRILFLEAIWFTGLLSYIIDGLGDQYLNNTGLFFGFVGTGLITLYGSYMVQRSLPEIIQELRPLLDLEDTKFEDLFNKILKITFNFTIVLLLGILFSAFISSIPDLIRMIQVEGTKIHLVWGILFNFFMYLLNASGVWLGISIWLSVLLISRQPIKKDFSFGFFYGPSSLFGLAG